MKRWDDDEFGFLNAGTPNADEIDDYFTRKSFEFMFGIGEADDLTDDDFAELRRQAHEYLDCADNEMAI